MNKLSEKNKKLIKICSIVAILILLISLAIILALRYSVEGEKNLPFKITSLRIASTAQGIDQDDLENKWNLDIIQKNDFYFYFEKNPDYSKEDSIAKVTFENFQIEKLTDKGSVSIYKPSADSLLYYYNDENKIENSISYNGALTTNIASLEIGNQGGLIGFSVAIKNLGNYVTNDDSEIVHNGTLLSKLNISKEDISMKISFDIIVETTSNNKFKSTLNFELPTGNIIEEGVCVFDQDNLDNIVFKRF